MQINKTIHSLEFVNNNKKSPQTKYEVQTLKFDHTLGLLNFRK